MKNETTMKNYASETIKFWVVCLTRGNIVRFADYSDAWKCAEDWFNQTGHVATVEPCY